MSKGKVIGLYFLLSLILIGSAVLLAYQVRQFLYFRQDSLPEIIAQEPDSEEVVKEAQDKELRERQNTLVVFNQTKSFIELATPVPKPSPTPVPPPSPTPVVPGRGYKINMATKSMASLRGYDGKDHLVKIGDTVQEAVWGAFKIVEIIPDINTPKVRVQHIDSGVIGDITEKNY